jgi:hypothetical protein
VQGVCQQTSRSQQSPRDREVSEVWQCPGCASRNDGRSIATIPELLQPPVPIHSSVGASASTLSESERFLVESGCEGIDPGPLPDARRLREVKHVANRKWSGFRLAEGHQRMFDTEVESGASAPAAFRRMATYELRRN